MDVQRIRLGDVEYVVVPRDDYERLLGLARVAELPALPAPDRAGNFPAVEYARASIARDIVKSRIEAGLSQRELAKLAGVRVETLCRVETGRQTASTATIAKIDRALKKAAKKGPARRKPA
jgi:DNA-binding XRE family transcriptional regulator